MITLKRLVPFLCLPLFLLPLLASSPAQAETCPAGSVYASCAPGWALTASTYPTTIAPGGVGAVDIDVINVGASASNGAVTVTDTLPPGVTATEAGVSKEPGGEGLKAQNDLLWDCTILPGGEANDVVSCTNNEANLPHLTGGGGAPTGPGNLPNYDPEIVIVVKAPDVEGAIPQPNRVAIAGGGAPTSASTENPIVVGSTPGAFRFTNWDVWFSNANGTLDTQAGSHPYEATFTFNLASEDNEAQFGRFPVGGNPREFVAELPPGFVGNPTVVSRCTREQLSERACPGASQVGIIAPTAIFGGTSHAEVFNMVPPAGVADELGFELYGTETLLDTGVRTGGDYGLSSHALNTPEEAVTAAVLTLWGEPGDPSHNTWRRSGKDASPIDGCTEREVASGECASPGVGQPFLTLPTACAGPLAFSIRANTWEHPETWSERVTVLSHDSNHKPAGITGCEHLGFAPAITTSPDTSDADTPAGLTVEVKPPVGGLSTPEGLSTSDIQNTTVTLPEGFVINPGQAAGLQACGPAEDGLTTEAEKAKGEEDAGPPSCPLKSKVGTVKIATPLLEGSPEKELEGSVYVLQSNPPELKLLVAASGDGVNLKLVGVVHLSETGQLTTKFEGTPELPFTDFKLSFSGGAQAALATPTQCGMYGPGQGFLAQFTPWSDAPGSSANFLAEAFPTAFFNINQGPGGGACPSNPLPFHPELIAGATNPKGGGFTNFSLLLQRGDGQQRIDGLRFEAPEGLTGFLSNVTLCTNAQAETNTCPQSSKIGHTVVESGPGPYPLVVPEPGQEPAPIYLTESYGGAPFGLSVVVPLHVGPFVLPTQRVRAKIEVNPITSQLIVTTNPLPQEVAGVPTDLREVDAVIEKENFMVNPTHCAPASFSGTAYGTPPPGQGGPNATAQIGTSFDVVGCKELAFAPKFSVSTSGKTSKSQGASLTAKVSYPSGPQGTYADVGKVKVELPKQLPSRLTTLQKACTNAQFETNPAACPTASKIGYATVHTPLLPVPLQGPAIFVSHGGEAFPSLTMVLQGDGVTVDLVGTTFISKAGITSTTFKTVPDDPFSTFELTLPEGPYSALAANGNLCDQKLTMPTEFKAQNGAEIKQDTKIAVTGCPSNISIESKNVSGKKTTLTVYVPAAGKLTASGKGLTSERKTYSGQEAQTFTLTQKKAGKLKTKIKLTFTPSKGKKQTKSLTVRFTR